MSKGPDLEGAISSNAFRKNVHIPVLDGVRGLAAFYVLVHHSLGIATFLSPTGGRTGRVLQAINFFGLGYGHLAVDVFIVLSGYCLMLPVARAQKMRLRWGLPGFMRRRALRILPTYYAALLASIVLVLGYTSLGRGESASEANSAWSEVGWASVGSHLLLIHNFHPRLIHTLNPPLWSIAVEWQIYFVFALLLLPLRRWLGLWAALGVALAVGLIFPVLKPGGISLEWTCPWYIGLFAMGMTAAEWTMVRGAPPEIDNSAKTATRARLACVPLLIVLVGILFVQRATWADVSWLQPFRVERWGTSWPIDLIAGLAAASGLVWLVAGLAPIGERQHWARRFLSSPLVLALGAISYSLYLIHYPVIYALRMGVASIGLQGELAASVTFFGGVALSLLSGILLYQTVERPTLRLRK